MAVYFELQGRAVRNDVEDGLRRFNAVSRRLAILETVDRTGSAAIKVR